jgi:hypothetical protein
MKARAARRLWKLVESPAHIEENTKITRLSRMIGRRPKVFASGTQNKFEAPRRIILIARSWVSSENGVGGSPRAGVDAYTGSALDIDELVKLTTKGSRDMHPRMPTFRHQAKFKGSAGSADG